MRVTLPQLNNLKSWAILSLGAIMVSCGSYQPSSYYDTDGIYADTQEPAAEQSTERVASTQAQAADEDQTVGNYKGYFGQKSVEAEMLLQQGDVFTDIDGYSSTDDITEEDYQDDVETLGYSSNEYAGWGETASDNLVINVYGNNWGWGGLGWGWGGEGWGCSDWDALGGSGWWWGWN